MPSGGARPNSGRKSIAEEVGTRDLAQKAIIKKYGSLEKGLQALLETNEHALMKFVFEHGVGKPAETLDITTKGQELKSYTIASASSKRASSK